MFKNMKIEINEVQPLDDVVKELERLGFDGFDISLKFNTKFIGVFSKPMIFTNYPDDSIVFGHKTTTLAALKEM